MPPVPGNTVNQGPKEIGPILVPYDQEVTVLPPYPDQPPPPKLPPPVTPPSNVPPIRGGQVVLRSHRVRVVVNDQIATTTIEQEFVNEGAGVAEGEYLFPLPAGAAVSNLTMFINGQAIQAQLLDARQAEQIYNETVRRLRDPALLQYVGRSAIQAKVFPIPSGETRKIQIEYGYVLPLDNGLISYRYPLKTDYLSNQPARDVSVSVELHSKDPIRTVYSPDSSVAIRQIDERTWKAGFEASNYRAADDFSLFYGVANSEINANLITYRGSADEDGFFMLMLTPPIAVDTTKVDPKDVIIVLDQSGSMQGPKWDQARGAVQYMLAHLNPNDRFNVVVFSTGYRTYARKLQPVSEANAAAKWVQGMSAEGGTDIDGALGQAVAYMDNERTTNVIFLTDGQPTEGETDINRILARMKDRAKPNLRLFTFGVGDDVNTFLLDTLSSEYRGQSTYVRPAENIEAKVSALYNKITAPVLADVRLDFGALQVDDLYPAGQLPDLFAGSQLIVAGRYRRDGNVTVTLTGTQNGEKKTYTYSAQAFPANAGGEPFVARLWATRKIGALLNTIRLKGQTPELVDAVVKLSTRYGIITAYTSYLIQENDINNQLGVEPVPQPGTVPRPVVGAPTDGSKVYSSPTPIVVYYSAQAGSAAVDRAADANEKAEANAPAPAAPSAGPGNDGSEPIKIVGSRTFLNRSSVWVESTYDPAKLKATDVKFLSDAYFALLTKYPDLKDVFALGDKVIFIVDGAAYQVVP
jgi:Ca-activated chloride channel family protein